MTFKSKLLSFMTKVKPNNGNETKSHIFPWDIFKSDTISPFYQNILKYFNNFQNRNFSILWLKQTQIMGMKQNHTILHGTYSNLTFFSLVVKYWNISMTIIIGTFQSHYKSEHNQVKWNKITRDMCKSDSIFLCKRKYTTWVKFEFYFLKKFFIKKNERIKLFFFFLKNFRPKKRKKSSTLIIW